MIKINLLGEAPITDSSRYGPVYAYFASFGALIALFFFLYSATSSSIAELTQQKERLESELAGLEQTTKEVRQLEKNKKDLDDKLSVIARLKLSKQGPVRLVDDINLAVPSSLWLTDVKELNNVMELRGLALDNSAIVDFMKNLEKSEFFKSVDLMDSTQVYLVKVADPVSQDALAPQNSKDKTVVSLEAALRTGNVVHKVTMYESLSKEQRDAFDRDIFGYGIKVRSFALKGTINYAGRLAATPTPAPDLAVDAKVSAQKTTAPTKGEK